jgi:hypothetical protein
VESICTQSGAPADCHKIGVSRASDNKKNQGLDNTGVAKPSANTTPSKQPHTVWEDAKEALLINDIQRVYVTTKKLVTDTVNYVGGDDKEKQAAGSSFRANWQEYVGLGMMLITRGRSSETAGSLAKPGTYRPARALPRDAHGNPMPDSVLPHTQLGTATSRRAGEYTQAREWGYDEKGNLVPIRDIDFTDHGRPQNHTNPHQHDYVPNPTGGTSQHGPAKPMEWP